MRTFILSISAGDACIALAALLLFTSACERRSDKVAGIPTYISTRDWIVKHAPTNAAPKEERIFVGHDGTPQYASIILYHPGINLREIVDQTPFKKATVTIYVIRRSAESGEFVTVKSSEKPEFEVKSLDVIWVWVYDEN